MEYICQRTTAYNVCLQECSARECYSNDNKQGQVARYGLLKAGNRTVTKGRHGIHPQLLKGLIFPFSVDLQVPIKNRNDQSFQICFNTVSLSLFLLQNLKDFSTAVQE